MNPEVGAGVGLFGESLGGIVGRPRNVERAFGASFGGPTHTPQPIPTQAVQKEPSGITQGIPPPDLLGTPPLTQP